MSVKSMLNVIEKPFSQEELGYSLRMNEVLCLIDFDKYHSIAKAYRYGFERGRRCERAKHKENLTPTEREIIAILHRNDEHFARNVLAFAFGMDKRT